MSPYRATHGTHNENPEIYDEFARQLRAPSRADRTRGLIVWSIFLTFDLVVVALEGLDVRSGFWVAMSATALGILIKKKPR